MRFTSLARPTLGPINKLVYIGLGPCANAPGKSRSKKYVFRGGRRVRRMGEASNGKVPQSVKYAIIGAGIHGLSTAFHLAQMLKKTGRGSGEDILVVDKTAIAAGASGIACGVIRNNYFQPAMRELMAHSVEVWESDPEAYSYHPVGYMQISPEVMHEDVATIHRQQQEIGYTSVFIEGEAECRR